MLEYLKTLLFFLYDTIWFSYDSFWYRYYSRCVRKWEHKIVQQIRDGADQDEIQISRDRQLYYAIIAKMYIIRMERRNKAQIASVERLEEIRGVPVGSWRNGKML